MPAHGERLYIASEKVIDSPHLRTREYVAVRDKCPGEILHFGDNCSHPGLT